MFTVRVDEPDPRFGTMLLEQFAARSMIHLLPSPEEGLLLQLDGHLLHS